MLRTPHRYLGLIAAIFLLNAAITGVILQFGTLLDNHRSIKSDPTAFNFSSPIEPLQTALAKAQPLVLTEARAHLGKDDKLPSVSRVSLDTVTGEVTYFLTGKKHVRYVVDPISGSVRLLKDDSFILRLHSGEIFGEVGHGIGIFYGSALIFLSLSGLAMYLQMWLARKRKLGRTRLFW